ncbi:hypothetical protein [Candidatus Epulonipiscium viviparus]|uniref:hypothetical protein n=1 Tax=Candidatus Epulonipiscium viviparus TaxID=420336 RepID=UPI00016BFB0E|nr:hypothetical protein [Candidatus Epulopiscium viviparus]
MIEFDEEETEWDDDEPLDDLASLYKISKAVDMDELDELEMLDVAEDMKDDLDSNFRDIVVKDEVETYKGEFDQLNYLMKNKLKAVPFDGQFPVDWVTVMQSDLLTLPQINAEWLKQVKNIKSYNYFILGKDQERNQFYVGIPALVFKSQKKFPKVDNIIEFVLKQPKSSRSTWSGNGYWIATI